MDDGVVRLTEYAIDDAPVLCEVDGDVEHRRRFDFPEDFTPSLEHSQRVIQRWAEERRAGVRFPFAVRDVHTGELLGGCEVRPLADGGANVSYWTHARHRRRGVAGRAVLLVSAFAFDSLRVSRLEILADADNVASLRVARRAGFHEVGERDGQVVYELRR